MRLGDGGETTTDRSISLDVLVIGAGTAGQTVARKCAAAGWDVAIVDELPDGGTCALRCCDPKKVLVAAAEAWDWQRRLAGKGASCQAARIEWDELGRVPTVRYAPLSRYNGALPSSGVIQRRKLGGPFKPPRVQASPL